MKILLNESQLKKLILTESNDIDYVSEILINYYVYNDKPNVKIDDKKLLWVFNQFIGIIDELKYYHINSEDFVNLNNIGFKKNGNIGYFDIGFGNFFENFETDVQNLELDETKLNIDNRSLSKIIKKFTELKHRKLGKGGEFGMAYDIGNDKVLKITTDKTEAVNSNKLIGKTPQHLAEVYDVKRYIGKDEKEYFIIILEKLKITKLINKYYIQINEILLKNLNKHISPKVIDFIRKKHPMAADFLEMMTKEGYDKTWSKYVDLIDDDTDVDYNEISDLSEWIKGSVTNQNNIKRTPPNYINRIIKSLL